jgi:hypothetical protein
LKRVYAGPSTGPRCFIPTHFHKGVDLVPSRDLDAGDLGLFVSVDACVQRVEHGQLRVIDGIDREVDGIRCVQLGPVGILGRAVLGMARVPPS